MFSAIHLHPMLVHFPIAILIVGFLFEIIGIFTKKEVFQKAAFYLLILGSIAMLPAYTTGDTVGESYADNSPLKPFIEVHENAAQISMWLAIAAAVIGIADKYLKKKIIALRWISFALFFLCVISLTRAGYTGGELVYKHGIGVDSSIVIKK